MDARLSDKVLSNQDLVRHLLSQSSDATGLLSISKAVRDGEPCSRQYERWSFQGCPSDGGECLRAIGGLDSTFCQGTYDLTVLHRIWPSRREDPAREVATRVVDLLGRRPLSGELVITLTLGSTTLRIRVGRENVISLIDRGWRKRGVVCKPTDALVRQLHAAVWESYASLDSAAAQARPRGRRHRPQHLCPRPLRHQHFRRPCLHRPRRCRRCNLPPRQHPRRNLPPRSLRPLRKQEEEDCLLPGLD